MINTRLANWLPPVVLFVLVIVIWDLGLLALGVQSFLLPRPTVIWAKLLELWPTTLARGVAFTASEALGGLAAGIVLGTAAGLATARWRTAQETLVPIAIGASTVPIIAFAPITLNWFGYESPLPRMVSALARESSRNFACVAGCEP